MRTKLALLFLPIGILVLTQAASAQDQVKPIWSIFRDPLFGYALFGVIIPYLVSPSKAGSLEANRQVWQNLLAWDGNARNEWFLLVVVSLMGALLVIVIGEPKLAKQAAIMGMGSGGLAGAGRHLVRR